MNRDNEILDLMSSGKKSFYKMIGILFFIINIIISLNFLGIDIVMLLEIYYLIISLVTVMLIYSIKEDNNKDFFYEISIIFIVISLFNMYAITFRGTEFYRSVYDQELEYFSILKLAYIVLGLNLVGKRLNNKGSFKKSQIKVGILTGLGVILAPICMRLTQFNGVILLIIIIYSLSGLKDIKRNKGNRKNINYIRTYIIIFNIKNFIIFINGYTHEVYSILIYLLLILTFIGTTVISIYVISKVLDSPYTNIQRKLRKSIGEIENLSVDLIEKNNEIEYRRNLKNDTEKIFKAFFRSIPMPIIIINSVKGNIVYVNKPGLEIFGEWNILDMVGKNFMELIKITNGENLKDISNKAYIGEIVKNNKKIAMECRDKRIEEEEEIILITDLTHKIEYVNIENRIKEKKLQEEMKSKFLSNISHDLKTPINVLYSSTQVQEIFINNKNIKELENHKNISKQNSFYLKRFANNIIDVSKIELGFLEKISLEEDNIVTFVEDIFESLVQYAKNKNISMIFDTEEEDLVIKFNKEYMERIILNIISNAIKYNRDNGEILLNIKVEKEFIEIIIKDTGIGIKEEFLQNIFKRYSKESVEDKSMIKSSGIGMYVVKKLVEAQRGEIIVNSVYNKGTEVVMRFIREI